MTDDDSASIEDGAASADYRQVAFVALAAFALILTAFVAPPAADQGPETGDGSVDGSTEPSDSGESGDPGGTGDSPDGSFDWGELIDWLDTGESEPTIEPGEPVAEQCSLRLVGDAVPGTDVTVVVRYEGRPLTDAPVWFDGERIGRTDETGRVTGEVPYETELQVRVGVPDDGDCEFVKEEVGSSSSLSTAGLGSLANTAVFGILEEAEEPIANETGGTNETVEYDVEGDVALAVDGTPHSGETVAIEASIEGSPMARATVEVDGKAVGRTGADGRAEISVPDDGRDRIRVRVSRGDFAGAATVEVLSLEAILRPTGLAILPGTTADVEARIGDEAIEGAAVTVDGERRGTTGPDGTLAVELPIDPTATVTVSADGRTARTSVAKTYRIVAPLFAFVVASLVAIAYRIRGAVAVLVTVASGLTVVIADAVWGPTGRLVAVGAIAAIALGAALVRWRRTVRGGAATTGGLLARAVERVVGAVLRIVRKLERAIDRLRAIAVRIRWWLESLPGSVSGSLHRLSVWLRSFPRRVLTALRGLTRATAGIAVACPLALVAGYALDDTRTGVAVAAALGVAFVAWRYARRGSDADGAVESEPIDADAGSERSASTAAATADADERRSFRDLWRAFARRVDPTRWRTRTPGEIARNAIDQGYPDEPVRELTTLFREVEYGPRSATETVRERAEDAYGALEPDRSTDAREGEE